MLSQQYNEAIHFAILAPRNDDVREINEQVLDFLDDKTEKMFTSLDSTELCDNGELENSLPTEYLNTLNPPTLPPHRLRLRKNSIIMYFVI